MFVAYSFIAFEKEDITNLSGLLIIYILNILVEKRPLKHFSFLHSQVHFKLSLPFDEAQRY